MHLGRRPFEAVDSDVQAFYGRLMECLKRRDLRVGRWRLLDCKPAWDGNPTWWFYLAFAWEGDVQTSVIAVNYGPNRGQCRIRLPFTNLTGKKVSLIDLMGLSSYERDGNDLAANGLFIDLPGWGYNVFDWSVTPNARG
jgi:hypothetical protein